VEPAARLLLTEGDYLIDESEPLGDVRRVLTEVWFCHPPEEVRRQRLVARHIRFGKTPAHAPQWVDAVDERNAERVEAARRLADLVVHV
jgi:pantothenate kinase